MHFVDDPFTLLQASTTPRVQGLLTFELTGLSFERQHSTPIDTNTRENFATKSRRSLIFSRFSVKIRDISGT